MSHEDYCKTIVLTKPPVKTGPSITYARPAGAPKLTTTADGDETIVVKKISSTTAQFIIKARTEKNLKQTQLASMCNLDAKIIGEIERGGCTYNFEHLNKIGKALGVKIPRD
jgi:ribosome-binding protein aMBF1 (putative translation factor)